MEQQKNKTVVNKSGTLKPTSPLNKTQELSFSDNRTESTKQNNYQHIADNYVQRKTQNISLPTNNIIQKKIFIKDEPYEYQKGTHRLHNMGKDFQHTFTPDNPKQTEEWSDDLWKRYYKDVTEFQNHASGTPVDVGLYKPLGLWYKLPFNPGHPFLMGENHSTKFAPIMKESNRKGSILNESNGVIPIKQKSPEKKADPTDASYHKTAMESIIAKTMFGVAFHKAEEFIKPSNDKTEKQDSEEWIKGYNSANKTDRGKDKLSRPFYKENLKTVIQGEPGKAAYDSTETMGRVKVSFDEEADKYIKNNPLKVVPCKYIQETKDMIGEWWTKILLLQSQYKVDPNADYTVLMKEIDVLREKILKRLETLFKEEYKTEIASDFTNREAEAGKALKGHNADTIKAMAMRDLAMLTTIKAASQNWGDHEMIVMGEKHVETQRSEIEKITPKIPIITRSEFINDNKNALPD